MTSVADSPQSGPDTGGEHVPAAVPGGAHEALRARGAVARALRDATYEILPFRGTEDSVCEHVSPATGLTVTTTEAKGLDPTLDLAVRLTGHGYRVAPHLAARLVRDRAHLADIVARLRDGGVERIFVIAGDAPEPAGSYTDALGLLRDLDELGRLFTEVGIGGYPEGHGRIDDVRLDAALRDKAPHATQVITQLCFDAGVTTRWAAGLPARGVTLPVRVGIPGAVSRQKLVRVSAGLGLGQSARFLAKQTGLLWRFLLPGGYNPDRLLRGLAPALARPDSGLGGVHVFTFNDLASTEAWRRRRIERAG
ncbi:methylenetetrahydrofolate reductase [Pseudonocardia nematodicida]|uniref:Methylenetetrahydrofolate reductase n=1 Tax=Pseudonocardia nematodicida TaxID=1206997 RepID=A0ABV1K553_9PSEU